MDLSIGGKRPAPNPLQAAIDNAPSCSVFVFDMNGDYYVAVPLDAPPMMNPAEREELRVEAQLLANLFASFEREKIFKRTLLPTTGSIQKRLGRQDESQT